MKQLRSSEDAVAEVALARAESSAAASVVAGLILPVADEAELDQFLAENVPRESTGALLKLLRPYREAKPGPWSAHVSVVYQSIYGELCRRAAADPKAFHDELCIADIWDVFEPTLRTVARSMPPLTDAEVAKATKAARFMDRLMSSGMSKCDAEETALHKRLETLIQRRCGIGAPRAPAHTAS